MNGRPENARASARSKAKHSGPASGPGGCKSTIRDFRHYCRQRRATIRREPTPAVVITERHHYVQIRAGCNSSRRRLTRPPPPDLPAARGFEFWKRRKICKCISGQMSWTGGGRADNWRPETDNRRRPICRCRRRCAQQPPVLKWPTWQPAPKRGPAGLPVRRAAARPGNGGSCVAATPLEPPASVRFMNETRPLRRRARWRRPGERAAPAGSVALIRPASEGARQLSGSAPARSGSERCGGHGHSRGGVALGDAFELRTAQMNERSDDCGPSAQLADCLMPVRAPTSSSRLLEPGDRRQSALVVVGHVSGGSAPDWIRVGPRQRANLGRIATRARVYSNEISFQCRPPASGRFWVRRRRKLGRQFQGHRPVVESALASGVEPSRCNRPSPTGALWESRAEDAARGQLLSLAASPGPLAIPTQSPGAHWIERPRASCEG